jgi:cytidylate kinase
MNLGIIGKLGSGKTSAANYLINEYGFKRYSLADPIKEIASELLDVKDKTDPRARKILQMIGTEWFRSIDDLVWVKYMKKRIDRDANKRVVCDDVRFMNEAESTLGWGWRLIYLDSPLEIRKQRCINRDGVFNDALLNHPSETGVDDILDKFCNYHNGVSSIAIAGVTYWDSGIISIDSSGSMDEMNTELDKVMERLEISKKGLLRRWWEAGTYMKEVANGLGRKSSVLSR